MTDSSPNTPQPPAAAAHSPEAESGSFPIAGLCPTRVNPGAPKAFSGAIFDLDGTLVDSMDYWDSLGPNYLAERGIESDPVDHENFKTLTLEEAAVYVKNKYGLPESADEVYDAIMDGMRKPYLELIPLKPGVAHMLNALDAAGVRMCIATASEKELVVPALERLGIAHHFQDVYTCPEVGVSKSQPDVFEWALRELGTPREATVVIEDSLHAIETAKRAGFPVIAVHEHTAAHNVDEIEEMADAVVASFADMEE